VEHVYRVPDTYVGSIAPDPREEFIFDLEAMKQVYASISISRAIERLFLEVLSNAGDNTIQSLYMGMDPGSIEIAMDSHWVTIRNGGAPIPIEKHKDFPTEWTPVIIFGRLRVSSNYEVEIDRVGAGRNGFGAKLANIFSKVFRVTCANAEQGLKLEAEWTENMSKPPTVTVEEWTPTKDYPLGFTEVSWKLDFERFSFPDYKLEEYPDEAFCLFARHAAAFSLTCKVVVYFNGIKFDYRSIRNYALTYWDTEAVKKAVVHYEWEGGKAPKEIEDLKTAGQKEKLIAHPPNPTCFPTVEMIIFDTPDEGTCLSFVNGLMTAEGGAHVSEGYKAVSDVAIDALGKILGMSMRKGKPKKGKVGGRLKVKESTSKKEEAPAMPKITANDVKRHVSMVISCRLKNPTYESQSKTQLKTPKPKISIGEKLEQAIVNWKLVDRLYRDVEAKIEKANSKGLGKGNSRVIMPKGAGANDAGTERSQDCVLYLVEGQSASAYPKKRIDQTPHGRDLCGFYPLKGKFMNVSRFSSIKASMNEEIVNLRKIGGLQENLDYRKEDNVKGLRYGLFLINTDSDTDGYHIAALLFNFFHTFYPTLIQTGRVGYLRTPVIRVFEKDKVTVAKRFYTVKEFTTWNAENPGWNKRYHPDPKYYKGLGTSRDSDILDDMDTAPVVTIFYDPHAVDNLEMAFNPKLTDTRKNWMARWREATGVEDLHLIPIEGIVHRQAISDFINGELIEYTKEALRRAIPSIFDGMKDSQRKALYAALHYWNFGKKTSKKEMKVGRFANAASDKTHYHHGEKSMAMTIIKMAQDFTGSNNLPFFTRDGQFGTRSDGGADAADARYSETRLDWWIPYVYDEEMLNVIPRLLDEGEEIETEWIPAIIPMLLVNGATGVATGHNTFIPSHNPIDLINYIRNKCHGVENTKRLQPWYRGFIGEIKVREKPTVDALEDATITTATATPSTNGLVDEEEVENDLVDDTIYKMEDGEEEEAEEEDEEDIYSEEKEARKIAMKGHKKGRSVKTYGKFTATKESNGKWTVKITELPIALWAQRYYMWLQELMEEKKISNFKDHSNFTTGQVSFTILGMVEKPTIKTLKLTTSFGLSNMTVIDNDGIPYTYSYAEDIMNVYFDAMIEVFSEVRQQRINKVEAEISKLTEMKRFIGLVLNGDIVIITKGGRSKKDILLDMDAHKVPHKMLEIVKSYDYTIERQEELDREIGINVEKKRQHEALTPEFMWCQRLDELEKALRSRKY
jgi:DNA topoisomerase-2